MSKSAFHSVRIPTHLVLLAARYYPPKTNGDLRNLHKAIVESTGADIHKISVLYYLLLNIDFPTGGRDHSTTFEKNCFLPGKYQIYMKGLWHLDRQEFEVSTHIQHIAKPQQSSQLL